MNTKCGLCKFTPKGKRDMDRHVRDIHKLTWDQYAQAVKAVAPALAGINMIQGAMRKAGMLAAAFALLTLGGCRGLDRLLGNNDSDPVTVPAGPVQIAGLWSGSGVLAGDITIDGHLAIMTLDVPTQTGSNVSGLWTLALDNSNQPGGPPPTQFAQGTITGTIDAAGLFTYTLVESPTCPADSHGTGQVSGNSMSVSWTGSGNPSCALWFDGGTGTLTK